MAYQVDFLHKCYVGTPGSWLAVTVYTVAAKNSKEAKLKAIKRFKAKLKMKRFMNADWIVTIEELK